MSSGWAARRPTREILAREGRGVVVKVRRSWGERKGERQREGRRGGILADAIVGCRWRGEEKSDEERQRSVRFKMLIVCSQSQRA